MLQWYLGTGGYNRRPVQDRRHPTTPVQNRFLRFLILRQRFITIIMLQSLLENIKDVLTF